MQKRRTIALLAPAAACLAAAAATAPTTGTGALRWDRTAVKHVYAAGHNPSENEKAPELANPLGVDNANNNVSNFLKYTAQAKALPAVETGLRWQSKGPVGIDQPPGFSQSGERFARVAGMGATVAAQPGSPNVVYIGNMGGLWRSADAGAHWTNLTDGKLPRVPIGAVAIDPADAKTIYVGTGISYLTLSGDVNGTGIYVTHDTGAHWSRPKQSNEGYGSNAIAITPSAILYGSNRGLSRLDKSNPAAGFVHVVLPTNAAGTAEATGFLANWVSDVVAKPGSPQEITVAVGFPLGRYKLPSGNTAAPGNGLYRSADGGKHFTRLTTANLGNSPTASADPIGRIRLAYGQAPGQSDVLWAAVSDAGLAAGLAPGGLDVVADQTGSINVSNTTFNGLYRSDDDGANWTMKANPQSLAGSENSLTSLLTPLGYGSGVQGFYNLWVATDPKIADQVYLGLEEVYQSQLNAGSSPGPAKFVTVERYADLCGFIIYYQNVPPTYGVSCPDPTPIVGGMSTHPDQHTAVVVPTADGSRIYTGNDGGFFRQDSHALTQSSLPTQVGFDNQHWTAINDLSTTQPYHVALKPDGEVLAALQDNGSVLVPKDGHGIEACGGDGVFVLATPDPNVWYCTTPNLALYVTTDNGKTITEIQPGAVGSTGAPGRAFTSPVAIDPTDPNHVVGAARGVWETTKGAATSVLFDPVATSTILSTDWKQSYDAGNSPNKSPATGTNYAWSATALAVRGAAVYDAVCGACRGAFTNPKLLLTKIATNVKKGCSPAKASTACWHLASSIGLPKGWITSIVIDPKDTRTLYVSVGQQNPFEFSTAETGSAKVLVSHDGGEHFTDITGNLPRTEARGLALRGNHLIVASEVGVFQDAVGDGRWARLGSGLPAGVGVHDLYIDASGRHLLAALYGRGVWELTFPSAATSNTSKSGSTGRSGGGGSLAKTGLATGVPTVGVLLFVTGLALRRRRAAAPSSR
jgi:hypothetical protein